MIALVHGRVLTITHGIFDPGVVLIGDGKIDAVGESVPVPATATVCDMRGKVIMPGMIDAHCHVGLFPDGIGWEYSDGNELTDPITPHLRALDAIDPNEKAFQEIMESGVTTVLTGPGSGNLIGGQWICLKTVPKATIREMTLLEPAGMKMALGENPRRVYGEQKKMPSTRMGNAAILRSALVDAQNYRAKWNRYRADLSEYEQKRSAGDKDAKEPALPERSLKLEALSKVLDRQLKARVHAHRSDDMQTAIRIAEEFNLDLTLEHATEGYKIAELLAEKQIPVTVGPILFSRVKYELKDMTPKNPGLLAKAGVKVAIQTDEASAVKYLNINAALAVREGMPEEEALKAITINAAEIIGVEDRVGSIENGKDADLIVMSGHPFDYRSVVETVFVDGKKVYDRQV